uniref:Iron-sulfur cluster formation ABC transporter n=1 Tax=Mallomonas splendens TaxID=52552 RepID=A0A3G2QZH6_9STRA|nr:iron-sulfur cluster formation ABC transporter [Mallomonas splendens]AYO28517.1 iron-sulfur cluster formation ABC transporter [Mallomonas splendens]
MSENKNQATFEIKQVINQPYKYGFQTKIESEKFPSGINQDIVKLISKKKNEPEFLLNFRLKAFQKWEKMKFPEWANLSINNIDFQSITYYSSPKTKKKINSLDEVDPEILKTFEKLGISLDEQKKLSNVAVDAVFDSISIATTFKEKLAKYGVIFCSISEAIEFYPNLVEKFLGTVVSSGDNFFAALNSSVFSDGSFCFIPQNVNCPLELSTYFRINDKEAGQFERTLIIAEKNSSVNYLEGCTAPQYSENQLHAAIVELIAFENAKIKYSTVQNWYSGNEFGIGGIYNFVTKRGLCLGKNSNISWTQVETGSSITWKYPSCLLVGANSSGEFYSVALTNNYQQADTGTKMIHLGQKTKSKIISKGISCGNSKNSYRGLVKISSNASYSRNFSQCDSFLIGTSSTASTYPYLDIWNATSIVEHEAKISKISEDQLFYLMQRGINIEQSISLLISGFCKEVFTKLPMEFATEADKLLSLKLEGTVG